MQPELLVEKKDIAQRAAGQVEKGATERGDDPQTEELAVDVILRDVSGVDVGGEHRLVAEVKHEVHRESKLATVGRDVLAAMTSRVLPANHSKRDVGSADEQWLPEERQCRCLPMLRPQIKVG